MYQKIPFLTEKLKTAHEDAWGQIAGPGDFFSGEERIEMVRATRDADGCELTIARKNAISPFAVSGEYVGNYILDSNGHRQLNPSCDSTKVYTPRAERQEWDAIGMVGKLRIRKGQQTGTRWIKMRDISDSVEEWLVR